MCGYLHTCTYVTSVWQAVFSPASVIWIMNHGLDAYILYVLAGKIYIFVSFYLVFSSVCLSVKSMPTLSMWSSTSCWEQLSIFCSTFLTNASTSTMLSLVMLVETVGRMECKQIALRKQTHLRGRANCMRTIFPLNCDWCLQASIFTFHGVLWRR